MRQFEMRPNKLITIIFLLSPFFIYGQIPPSFASASFECEVYLDIYNGLYDWSTNTAYSGGQLLGSGEKYDKGAVTVANINDTDGDLIDDASDDVVEASAVGRNEVDLMKLVIRRKGDPVSGNVILELVKGNVRLWRSPDKTDELVLSGGKVTYAIADLNITLYVEAVNISQALRDIEFHLHRDDKVVDKVRATGVYTTFERSWSDNTTTPLLNTSGAGNLPTCNHPLAKRFNSIWKPFDSDQRYGFGQLQNHDSNNDGVADKNLYLGGRILFEFKVYPENAETLVTFDLARQKKVRGYKMEYGESTISPFVTIDFPEEMMQDNEKPNDSVNNSTMEDREPNQGLIYSGDRPATALNNKANDEKAAFKINKITFREYVRVYVEGGPTTPNDFAQNVEGSRASEWVEWHCVYYVKKADALGDYEEDNEEGSINSSARRITKGNGTITLGTTSVDMTEAYTVFHTPISNQWLLLDSQAANPVIIDPDAGGNSWTINTNGLNVVIQQGSTPFEENDAFFFNTFKTESDKINAVGLGMFDVLTSP